MENKERPPMTPEREIPDLPNDPSERERPPLKPEEARQN